MFLLSYTTLSPKIKKAKILQGIFLKDTIAFTLTDYTPVFFICQSPFFIHFLKTNLFVDKNCKQVYKFFK